MEVKVGDVVRGAFAVKGETLIDHHSVVVDIQKGHALLVYTASLKQGDASRTWKFSRAFDKNEMQLANWRNPCRYEASKLSIVPVSQLELQGRVPSKLLKELAVEMDKAKRMGCLQLHQYNPSHPEVRTGYVSAQQRRSATV
jgi:hypothetical protein